MDRKRLRHTRNCSKNVRKSLLDKRVTSLFKKAEEFSILCGIDVAIIIFSPGEIQPIVWKSTNQAKEILMRYSNFPVYDRLKKLMTHEAYLSTKVDEKEENIKKIEKMNEEKEMEILFNQLVEGKSIAELSTREIQGLLKFSSNLIAKLHERKEKVNQQGQPSQPQICPSNFKITNQNQLPNEMEDLINDMWFVETMAAKHNYICPGDENNSGYAPT
ncbi:agamous-like MADS-box protein AGL92 [Solanum dulcamara]|uniref:agamous-like MADS-box protein AGL92 n=1 Tax=Solanum dulcamara TaxID=45834 RepID=UPI002485006A|nr:agamous-like MADS-box protein AGL92 [Solanum dulcamara]